MKHLPIIGPKSLETLFLHGIDETFTRFHDTVINFLLQFGGTVRLHQMITVTTVLTQILHRDLLLHTLVAGAVVDEGQAVEASPRAQIVKGARGLQGAFAGVTALTTTVPRNVIEKTVPACVLVLPRYFDAQTHVGLVVIVPAVFSVVQTVRTDIAFPVHFQRVEAELRVNTGTAATRFLALFFQRFEL